MSEESIKQVEPPATVAPPPASIAAPAPLPTDPRLAALLEMPLPELRAVAEDFGLEARRYKSKQHLAAAIAERRDVIATLDREAMLDVIRWGRRPVAANAPKEQLAVEIARLRSMKFDGLSQRGLIALAHLRGIGIKGDEASPQLIKRLKKSEGFFSRMNRKRRAWLGDVVANMLGEKDADGAEEYQYLPTDENSGPRETSNSTTAPPPIPSTVRDDIEESGLFSGIANRVKRSADSYLNQKLDEIEGRIDRKLDEIDRRLADWRDKEIANRIRIFKMTLWISVIVAMISLAYAYWKVYIRPAVNQTTTETRR